MRHFRGPLPKANFMAALKRNLREMKPFRKLLYIAIVLAIASSVISSQTPKRLAVLTDEISKSLQVDIEKMSALSSEILENMAGESPQEITYEGEEVSLEDQSIYINKTAELKERNIDFSDKKEISKEDQEFLLETYSAFPKSIINIIEPKLNKTKVWDIAKVLIIMYLITALFSYLNSVLMTDITNDYAKKLRKDVAKKINKLPLSYFDRNQIGDILSRMTNDVDQVASNLNESLGTITKASTLLVGSVVMMFVTNWILALVAIVSSLIGFAFAGIIIGKSQKHFSKRQKALGEINGHTEEVVSGIQIVKIYNAKDQSCQKFTELNKDLFTASVRSKFLSNTLRPLMGFIGNFGYLAVSITGAVFAQKGLISIGIIVAFMTYVRMFTNPLNNIAQALGTLQASAAASERVFELLDEEELKDESHITSYLNPLEVRGEIEFKDLVFTYPTNEEPTIKGFSAKAEPGQKIAIVGPTGAGKSTMVNLLMKFYEITDGDILIDGQSIKNISRENVHELFTMILQDTWLFHGTVRDNIVYNMEDVSDSEIETLLDFIGLSHFIKTLPEGLDTVIRSNDSVSAGQRQLLTIARGMLKDAPFLILDEATSNVDTRTEEVIQEAMDKLMHGRTSFIIAHRLSTIVNSDIILVMRDGNIVEQGSHKELIEQDGFYAELYNSQFSLGV